MKKQVKKAPKTEAIQLTWGLIREVKNCVNIYEQQKIEDLEKSLENVISSSNRNIQNYTENITNAKALLVKIQAEKLS